MKCGIILIGTIVWDMSIIEKVIHVNILLLGLTIYITESFLSRRNDMYVIEQQIVFKDRNSCFLPEKA